MIDVFISYATEDREAIRPLVDDLTNAGWNVWWDREIDAGISFEREIEKVIESARCVLVVWSRHSVESDWVRAEANEGLDRNVLIPVSLDDTRPPLRFRQIQTIPMNPFNQSIKLIREAVETCCPQEFRELKYETPCIAREGEISRSTQIIDKVRSGNGSILFIAGEAGIGKTRVTREIALIARQCGFLLLRGHCLNMQGAAPYQPLIEQINQLRRQTSLQELREILGENAAELAKLMPELRDLFPDLPSPPELPPEQERRYLLHGVAEFLKRSASNFPLLLTFEDLHWADESTCVLLRYLADQIEEAPILILGTYRDNELAAGSPFSRALKDLLQQRLAEELVLSHLSKLDVSRLFELRANQAPPQELIDLVYSETDGNPFFVEELYRHLQDANKLFNETGQFKSGIEISDTEVPRSVLLILGERIERVDENCRKVLTQAAILGRAFKFDILLQIMDMDEDTILEAIENAEASHLIRDASREREARYEFNHEQIRQTLLNQLSFPRRQRLHLRVADALEAFYGDGNHKHAEEIAHHLYQAGAAVDEERTARYLFMAGERALEAMAYEDALKQFDLVLSIDEGMGNVRKSEVFSKKAKALRGIAQIDTALNLLQEAMKICGENKVYNDLLSQRIQLYVDLYRGREAARDAEELDNRARQENDIPLQVSAQLFLARAQYIVALDNPEGAAKARISSEKAISLAREMDDQRTLGRALLSSSYLVDLFPDYFSIAKSNLQEALDIARKLDDDDLLNAALTHSSQVLLEQESDSLEHAEAERARLIQRQDPLSLKEHLFWMAWAMYARANPTRCVEVCDEAISLCDRLGAAPVQYPTIKALALIDLGDFSQARDALEAEVTDEDHPFGRAFQAFGYICYYAALNGISRLSEMLLPAVEELVRLNRHRFINVFCESIARLGSEPQYQAVTSEWLEKIDTLANTQKSRLYRANRLIGENKAKEALDLLGEVENPPANQHKRRIQLMGTRTRAHAQLQDWDMTLKCAEQWLNHASAAGYALEAWPAQYFMGQALVALEKSTEANAHFSQARQLLEEIVSTIPPDISEARSDFLNNQLISTVLNKASA